MNGGFGAVGNEGALRGICEAVSKTWDGGLNLIRVFSLIFDSNLKLGEGLTVLKSIDASH